MKRIICLLMVCLCVCGILGCNREKEITLEMLYEHAKEQGYVGDFETFRNVINGQNLVSVENIYIDEDGHLMVQLTGEGVRDLGDVVGEDGAKGADGKDGKNGQDGKDGKDGKDGQDGKDIIVSSPLITKGEIGSTIFTMNVKYHALSQETSQVSYYSGCGFGGYDVKREHYQFVGVEYKGKLYKYYEQINSYGALAADVIASGESSIDVTAIWECEFEPACFGFGAIAEYQIDGDIGNWSLIGEKDGQKEWVGVDFHVVKFQDEKTDFCIDANANAYEYCMGRYTNIQTLNGEAVTFDNEIKIYIRRMDGVLVEPINVLLAADVISFAEILTFANTEMKEKGYASNVGYSVDVSFVFKVEK
ncbi:MAG: hypothetical protein IJW51_07455 [Clostridia bacterium]|nr:hypothetical protein [Clostridia bacterium]